MNINRFYSMLVLLCLFFTAQQLRAQCDLIFTNEITDISCSGIMDGAIDVTISGATDPVSYIWSNGQTDADITGLSAGVYTVTATDALGCTGSVTSTINTSTNVLSLILNDDGIINCQNPNSDIVPDISGGVVPYSFFWSTGSTDDMIAVPSGGTYTVTITDAAGCTITAQKAITQSPSYPVADPGPLEWYPTCATGPAMLGGPGTSIGPDFAYQWYTFTGSFDPGVDPTQPTVKVTAFGAYILTVT
ncbi:MAG: SprB repeat-containing protein, partial [Saprospiraceae bacterium]